MPCLAPRMVFWEPLGTKPCLLPELDQIWFGGHILANNKINVPSFEIGDEICHFWGTKSAMFWPPKSGDSFSKVFGNFYPILTKLGVKEGMDHSSMLGNSNYQIYAI